MKKIIELDDRAWEYTLYEVDDSEWIVSFAYSPKSYVDASLTIRLTEEEKKKAQQDSEFLSKLSKRLRNKYKDYYPRALDFNISVEYIKLTSNEQ